MFAKELNSISGRHHTSQVFDDFLQMTVCAFSMKRSEDLYIERAKKYNEEEIKGFSNALGALIIEHEKQICWKDYLGDYFENFGQYNSKMGQFFTPVSICNLMAQFSKAETKEYRQTVNDPSCGSSRNLIAHARLDPKNRFNYFYIGQDLDKRCCLMSVLNFVLYGMAGVVIHMNCLSLEIYGGWRIWMPETMMGVQPLSIEECNQYIFEKKKETEKPKGIHVEIPVLIEKFPLTLFDV